MSSICYLSDLYHIYSYELIWNVLIDVILSLLFLAFIHTKYIISNNNINFQENPLPWKIEV